MPRKRILILGSTGMLGHTLFNHLSQVDDYDVFGTTRRANVSDLEDALSNRNHIRTNVDGDNFDSIIRALASIQPNVVINCIGLIKQLPLANDPLSAITVNAQLPHRLSLVCRTAGARMIHISTDCVFDGSKGSYVESDNSDATDLYGRTKFLGEVTYPHCLTLRTSIIGHELEGRLGLVEWFLSQKDKVSGYRRAIYSGFPTIELARVISSVVLPKENLRGLFHVSSDPISKFELLNLIARVYGKKIEIVPYEDFHQDRSLNSNRFRQDTGYVPAGWDDLVNAMYTHYQESGYYHRRRLQ